MKKIVYLDMDGPLANWCKAAGVEPNSDQTHHPIISTQKGFYRSLPLQDGAREAVSEILTFKSVDLFIASKPTTKNLWSATEKYQWVGEHFPELLRKIFLTCDKGHLNGDYLVDDYRERWEPRFKGTFLWFDEANPRESWHKIVGRLRAYKWEDI